MADIIITPLPGKIDFFTNKGDNSPINGVKLLGSNLVFYGPISASSVLTNGGGRYVTTTSPTINYVPKFNSNSSIANSLIFDSGTNVGIGTNKPSASLQVISSTSGATLLRADGTSGTLFSVVDDLTDSLMSVNNSAGLPVFEVFADDRIVAGQYGTNDFVLTNNKVGIGTNNPIGKLHVTGSTSTPAGIFLGDVGIGTTAPTSQANYRFLQVNGPTSAIIETTVGGSRIGGFDSTSNTLFVGTIGSYPIVFRTAVNEKMRIAADGNVGIGTTTPAYKLDINGITRFQNIIRLKNDGWNLTDEGQVRFYFDTSGRTYFGSGNGYEWRSVADAALMVLTNAGNVGIGTTSPVAKLDINGTSNFAPNVYHSIGGQKFFAGSGGAFSYIYTGTTALNFINGSDTSTLMSLLNNGNLGIGTTTPAYKFHIYSGSMYVQGGAGASVAKNYTSFSRLIFDTDHSDSARGPNKITLYDSGGWVGGLGVSSNVVGYYSGGNHIWHKSTSQTAFTEYMRLDSNGNLGIGTSIPNSKLFVSAGTLASSQRAAYISADITTNTTVYTHTLNLIDSSADANTTSLALGTYSHVVFRNRAVTAGSEGGILDIYTRDVAGNPTVKMTVTNTGNVGIGTTSPIAKLHTVGSNGATDYVYQQWSYINNVGVYDLILKQTVTTNVVRYNFSMINNSTAYNDVLVLDRGCVGIGTTFPGYKLDVNGTFNVSGTSTLAGVSVTGTINSSATEAIRINNNNGYISFYNTAGNTRTGYLQGNTGNSVILAAENSSAILFAIGGSEIARIATSGNVGIGTTAPARKLDISGSAVRSFSAGGTGEPGFIVDYPSSNGYGAFFIHVNGTRRWRIGSVGDTNVQPALNFWQEGTGSRMIINNLGNVGIGTSGPAGQLDVYSSGGASGYVRSSVSAIRLLAYGDGSNWIQSGTGTGTSAADLIFSNMTGTSQWMRIQGSTGNVGIGTTSPGAKLAIIGNRLTDPNNDAQSREIYYAVSRTVAAAAGSTTLLGYLTPTSRSDNAVIEIYHHDCGTIEYIRFVMNSAYYSGATTDWVQLPTISNISYSGNFNGCTVDARLASTGANIELRLRSLGGACADMAVFVSIKTNCLFTSQTTTGTGGTVSGILCNNGYDFPVGANRFEGTRNRGLYIINSGNVGINTQSPSAMLHVSGSTAGDEVFVGTISDNQIVGGRTGGSFGIATKTASNGNLILTANANIYLRSGGSNDRVFVKSDGNVGIGTTTLFSKFVVSNGSSENFEFGPANVSLNGGVLEYINRAAGSTRPDFNFYLGGGGGAFKFFTQGNNERMRIANDGNVGINTSSPAAKLDVNGSAIIRGALSSDSSRTTTYTTLTGAANDWFPLFTVGDSTDATVICNIKTFAHSSVTFTAARGYGPSQTHVITILNSQQNANGGYANITGVRIRQSGTVEIQLSWASGPAVDISAQLIGTYYTPTFVASLATTTAVDTIVDTISLQSGLIRTKRNMVADGYVTGGSVGAGISSPTSILHVRASAPGGTGTAPTGTNVLIDSDSSNYITFRNTADNGTYAGLAFLDNNVGGYIVFRNYTGNVLNGSDSMIYGTYQDHIFQNSSSETINGKTETMRIKSNGNVGIGTNAPTYRLHLSGSMLITGVGSGFSTPGSEAGYRLKFYDNGGVNNDTGIGLDGAGLGSEAMWFNALQGFYWNFGTNGEKMRLTSVGNLGIGTSVPSATLTVIATNNTGSRIQLGTATTNTFMDANKVNDFMILTAPFNSNPASVANAGAKWGIKMNGSIDSINIKGKSACLYAVSEDTIAGYNRQVGLALHTSNFDLDNVERVRVSGTGNVGIGTTNPLQVLHINGSILLDGVTNGYTQGATRAIGYGSNSGGTSTNGFSGMDIQSVSVVGNYSQNVRFWTHHYGQGSGGTPRMVIQYDGNIGIGSTAPVYKLDVNGTFRSTGDLYTNGNIVIVRAGAYLYINGTNSDAEIVWQANGSNRWAMGMNVGDATENFNVYNYTTATTNFTILKASGNVGIGTASPANKLSVAGAADIGNTGYVAGQTGVLQIGNISYNYLFTQGTWSSDIRAGILANCTDNWEMAIHDSGQRVVSPFAFFGGVSSNYIQMGRDIGWGTTNVAFAGSVGVGTTAPTGELHIYGSQPAFRIQSSVSGNMQFGQWDTTYNRIQSSGRDFLLISTDATNLIFSTNTSERMRITSGGNVGIGTTTVPTKFTTYVGSGAISGTNDAIRLQVSSYNNAGRNTIVWAQDTGNLVLGRYGLEWNSSNSQMNFVWRDMYNSGAGSTELMRLTGGGSLGIGTTTPSALLHAVSSTAGATLLRADGTSGTLFSVVDDLTDSLMSVNNSAGLPVFEVFADDRIVAGQYGVSDFVITNNKVGIGTNNPVAKLHISSSFTTLAAAFIGNVGIGTTTVAAKLVVLGEVQVQSNSAYTTHLNYADSGINFITMANGGYTDFRGSSNGVTTMRVKGDGNVGIGNSNPVYKLDVAGGDINFASTSVLRIGTVAVLNESSNANDIYANIRVIRNMSSVTQDGMYVNYNSTGGITSHLRFFANGTSERMRIQANDGFVGIGTTSAVGRLDVYDSTDAGHVFFVRNASTGTSAYSAIVLRRNGDANGIVLFTNSSNRTTDGGAGNSTIRTDNGNLLLGAGGTTYHALTTAGSVGIGSTSPACRLDVAGSIKVSAKLIQNSTTVSVSGTGQTLTLNLDTAAVYVVSMASGATITTISYTNRDNNPSVNTIMLVVKYAGTASITFTNVIWANGVAPTLTGTNGYADVFMLTSYQGGAGTPVWIGTVVAQALVSTNL